MIPLFGKRRRQDALEKPVRALILGGGGARGAYEAGVAAALSEREAFDVVCGTSIGAINGILVAQDQPERLIEVWRTISTRGVTRLKPELAALLLLWQSAEAVMSSPLSEKATRLLAMMRALPQLPLARSIPRLLGLFESGNARTVVEELADFDALRRTLIVGATNLYTGRGEAFAYFPASMAHAEAVFHGAERAEPIRGDNYVDAICASAALPPVYEPVPVRCGDGVVRLFADGGCTNNTPFRQAIDAGATDITAILVSPTDSRGDERPVHSMLEVASVMLEANTERMLELDLKLARRINDDVLAGNAPGKRYVRMRIIGPAVPLDLPTLGFEDQEEVDRLFALGYADGSSVAAATA
jgi:predicted acylesterase/phospholipase RssA